MKIFIFYKNNAPCEACVFNILKTCPRKAQKDTVSKKTFQTARYTGSKVMLLGFSQKTVGAQYLSWHQKKESETSQLFLFLFFFPSEE